MDSRVIVIEVPTLSSIAESIGNVFETIGGKLKSFAEDEEVDFDFHFHDYDDDLDYSPSDCDEDDFEPQDCGTPYNNNLRFGAAFEIDEPRCEDYNKRWQFESDHAAFDRFVEAGEDCVARGLEKKSSAPIHRCNAIRQRVDQLPPVGIDLIGESHYFDEEWKKDWWR